MPRGDRTGPMGMGGRTGRAAGYCAGFSVPGLANPIPGLGLGRGPGFWSRGFGGGGRGHRNMFYATGQPGWMRFGGYADPNAYQAIYQKPDPEAEKQTLESQARALRAELDAIEKRLAEIKPETADSTP